MSVRATVTKLRIIYLTKPKEQLTTQSTGRLSSSEKLTENQVHRKSFWNLGKHSWEHWRLELHSRMDDWTIWQGATLQVGLSNPDRVITKPATSVSA